MMKQLLIFLLSIFVLPLTGAANAYTDGSSPSHYEKPLFQLTVKDAEAAIAKALTEAGAGDNLAATIVSRKSDVLFTHGQPVIAEIRGLQFDKQARQWSANILFIADKDVISAIPSSGRFEEIMSIPVLKRNVRNGDAISVSDIELVPFSVSRVSSNTVTDMRMLVGKSPVHSISARRPIRANEIENPTIVKKNSIVQINYSTPGLQIVTAGQAIEDGALGDIISVRNVNSKRIVRAVIEDESNVKIVAITNDATSPSESALNTITLPSAGDEHATN
jgi:flagellar basal body P-ring formation protein FlgA